MKPFPTDPMRQHTRMIAAFCDDIVAGDCRTAPRAKAVAEISRQINSTAREREAGNSLPVNK